MPRPRKNNKRELLLDAAEKVALKLGAGNLTLDAVAKQAKVGKGGLIYHFPSKKALLQAMVERAHEIYAQSVRAALESPAARGDFALAHIRSLTAPGQRSNKLATIVITVASNYPELLQPIRESAASLYKTILAKKGAGESAVVAMLAVNGLFLMECLGMGPLSAKSRAKVIARMCAIAQGGLK